MPIPSSALKPCPFVELSCDPPCNARGGPPLGHQALCVPGRGDVPEPLWCCRQVIALSGEGMSSGALAKGHPRQKDLPLRET